MEEGHSRKREECLLWHDEYFILFKKLKNKYKKSTVSRTVHEEESNSRSDKIGKLGMNRKWYRAGANM